MSKSMSRSCLFGDLRYWPPRAEPSALGDYIYITATSFILSCSITYPLTSHYLSLRYLDQWISRSRGLVDATQSCNLAHSPMCSTPSYQFYIPLQRLLLATAVILANYGTLGKRGVSHLHHMSHPPLPLLEGRQQATSVPLVISNLCRETIFPGLLTQSGTGPGTGGFSLSSGSTKQFTVSEDWQGRVWGRTNCSFNSDGTAPASGIPGVACSSGDCGGNVNCRGAVCRTLARWRSPRF
jgi:hypothetical protein